MNRANAGQRPEGRASTPRKPAGRPSRRSPRQKVAMFRHCPSASSSGQRTDPALARHPARAVEGEMLLGPACRGGTRPTHPPTGLGPSESRFPDPDTG